ncbi:HEAT repeat domain-containing protein [Pedobacter agri]|uniref:HEAT repeat domain-containing protein n=1 Tax=Pedobacter agri TaxID=454586 RepID=UPI00292EBC84|nr:HEAT repeat domain-containing protein [Pedobacter agri]
MNDPLRRFIDSHSEDLDDLEPDAGIFLKIKEELAKGHPKKDQGILKFNFNKSWLVAASILIILCAGYLILINGTREVIVVEQKVVVDIEYRKDIPKVLKQTTAEFAQQAGKEVIEIREYKNNETVSKSVMDMDAIYKDLQDSTSSSTRLSAILKIGNCEVFNRDMVVRLAKTLATDGNSNVRLAAISVLGQYSDDEYVTRLLIEALSTQNDPNAQLGLIESLSRTDSETLDSKLHAMANDPNVISAVKDYAYLVLLNQNKL